MLSLDFFLHDFMHPSFSFEHSHTRASAKPVNAELPGRMSCHRISTGRCQFPVATDVARILVIGAMVFDCRVCGVLICEFNINVETAQMTPFSAEPAAPLLRTRQERTLSV
jgi:hypothetical protein